MKYMEEISQAIGSLFLVIAEARGSFKIDLIPELTKPEIRNIEH